MLSKLVPVLGNVCESNLGLEETALDEIVRDVDIIVNSAANTTFDERLKSNHFLFKFSTNTSFYTCFVKKLISFLSPTKFQI